MPITNLKIWNECVTKNDDPYGKACVDVAREVMRMLDEEDGYRENIDCHTLICRADKKIEAGGITGFMAGAVAHMIAACHSRGDEFRVAFNKDHGVSEEKAKGGVVNPAVVTIETGENNGKNTDRGKTN
jgi:hypothetical protein